MPLTVKDKVHYVPVHLDDDNSRADYLHHELTWKRRFYILLLSAIAMSGLLLGAFTAAYYSPKECPSTTPGAIPPYCEYIDDRNISFMGLCLTWYLPSNSTGSLEIRKSLLPR